MRRTRAPFVHKRSARTRTKTGQEARTRTYTHTRIGRHATARIDTHTVLAERHARHTCDIIASAAAFTCAATEGERHGRWSEMCACVGRPGANPLGIPRIPLEYLPPVVPNQYPTSTQPLPNQYPPTTPRPSRVRTSVGARPHVVEPDAAVAVVATDDVDGAGGVDHGRVPRSASPRRGLRTASPEGACGQRARTRQTHASRAEL